VASDPYEVLGVGRGAEPSEIKRAYRTLARQLHPDANPDDPTAEARFKEVAAAYEVLSDAERRARYDRFGHEGGPDGGDPFGGFGDIFDTFFSGTGFGGTGFGGRRRSGPPPGEDLETTLEVDFEDAVFGSEAEIEIRTAVACTTCEATGASPGTSAATCGECDGRGQVQRVRQSVLGQMVTNTVCPRCNGRGTTIPDPCRDCRGEGRRIEERSFTVEVRAGVDDGSTLRLTGRGAVGPRGGSAGDLYVHLRVAPHPVFEREGYDLVHRLHIPMTQAALGADIDYPTLDGDETLSIPAGTQTGRVFRLRGRGVPHVEGRGRGDLIVQVVVDTPVDMTDEAMAHLRRFAEASGDEVAPEDPGLLSRIRTAFR